MNKPQSQIRSQEFQSKPFPDSISQTLRKINKEKISNRDQRLLQTYFKEVGEETLFTPAEEIKVAAKIRKCQIRARQLKMIIEKHIGRSLGNNNEKIIDGLKEISDRASDVHKIENHSKHLSRLITLLKAYSEKGTQLRNIFIKSNLRLVVSVAKGYTGYGLPFLDLIQEGNIGLIKAVERCDYTKGYKFSTYACWWIHQSICRAITDQTRTIRVPAYIIKKSGKVRDIYFSLEEKTGRRPLPEEIAKEVNISSESVKRVLRANEKVVCLDSPVWQGEITTLMDSMPDPNSEPPDSLIASASLPQSVDEALLILSPREREILKMRFGKGLDLTRERVRQIEKRSLEKLRKSDFAPALRSLMEVCQ